MLDELAVGRIVRVKVPNYHKELPAIVADVQDEKEGIITAHVFHPDHTSSFPVKHLKPRRYIEDHGWSMHDWDFDPTPIADQGDSTNEETDDADVQEELNCGSESEPDAEGDGSGLVPSESEDEPETPQVSEDQPKEESTPLAGKVRGKRK